MNMWVIIKAPGVGMQNCGHTDVGAKIFGIYTEVLQRAGSACKKKVVNDGLVIPCQEPEFIGKREGCHEVVNRQKLFPLSIQPDRGFMILALWAASMSTGTRSQRGMTAAAALQHQLFGLLCSAFTDCIDCAKMTR